MWQYPTDASSLLMELSVALPNLATLQWRESAIGQAKQRTPTRRIFSAFIANHLKRPGLAREAPESLAGSGLRLLQAKQCSFKSVAALPASLQMCSLSGGDGQVWDIPLRKRLHLLLAPCVALRELYILHFILCGGASLDLPLVATSSPALRVLVLHISVIFGPEVSPVPVPQHAMTMQN